MSDVPLKKRVKNKYFPSGETLAHISKASELMVFPIFLGSVQEPLLFLKEINKSVTNLESRITLTEGWDGSNRILPIVSELYYVEKTPSIQYYFTNGFDTQKVIDEYILADNVSNLPSNVRLLSRITGRIKEKILELYPSSILMCYSHFYPIHLYHTGVPPL